MLLHHRRDSSRSKSGEFQGISFFTINDVEQFTCSSAGLLRSAGRLGYTKQHDSVIIGHIQQNLAVVCIFYCLTVV